MSRIEIRGVITPADYDVDYMFSYIQRGIITPESRFRKLLNEADKKKPLEVYVNSPGGSVFAGYEIINAIEDWRRENGRKVTVTVGALAASMGANIAIMAGDELKLHSNSKMMFHGAWGMQIGGTEAMRDYAVLLDKINAEVKLALNRKYGISIDTVDEWFAEGREGWLSADDAKEMGMTTDIIGGDDAMPETVDNLDELMSDDSMKIAAMCLKNINNNLEKKELEMDNIIGKLKQMFGVENEADIMEALEQTQALKAEQVIVEETAQETENTEDQPDEVVEDVGTDNDDDVEGEEAPEVDELKAQVDRLNEALNQKQSENDKLRQDVTDLNEKCTRLTGGGLAFEGEESAPSDWASALSRCEGDYVEARKKFPDLFKKFMGK